jgi:uncharacterized protein
MVTQLTHESIRLVTNALVDALRPEQVILFGSHAWGTPDADSDLDVLVIVSQTELAPIERVRKAREALRQFTFPKDVLVVTETEYEMYRHVRGSLTHDIWQRGKVLYDGRSKETAYS